MKKFLLCLGLIATSIQAEAPKESSLVGHELQKLIECSARDAALDAEMQVSSALLDAVSSLTERMKEVESSVMKLSFYTNLPGKAPATKAEMTAAQLRINELEKCINVLSASVDKNAINASSLADLGGHMHELENSLNLVAANAATGTDIAHLNMRIGEVEKRLNLTMSCFNKHITDIKSDIKVAHSGIASTKADLTATNANITGIKKDIRRRM